MKELKRIWPLLLIIGAAVWCLGDAAQLAVQLYTLSMVALVLLATRYIFADKKGHGFFPHIDMAEILENATRTSVGAAIVFAAICAVIICILTVATARGEDMLAKSRPYLPQVAATVDRHWPAAPLRETFPAQIEQESRWKKTARLHTSREDGYGFAQITVTPRFNNFYTAERIAALKGWDWRKDPYNVQAQITYLVLTDRANYTTVARLLQGDREAWAGALVAYNAGLGTVLQRRAVALSESPAPSPESLRWFNGLDQIRTPGEKTTVLYNRNLGDMRNDYPRLILQVRAPKYRGLV